jgi:hypothetical protein
MTTFSSFLLFKHSFLSAVSFECRSASDDRHYAHHLAKGHLPYFLLLARLNIGMAMLYMTAASAATGIPVMENKESFDYL